MLGQSQPESSAGGFCGGDSRPAESDPYAAAREEMIEHQLRGRGVVMHAVLEAMREIPRHLFVPREYAGEAYADEALPSSAGQTISQPFMVGMMTQELQLKPGMRVLEIGTGTGYQAAVLSRLVGPAGWVYSMERIVELAEAARRRLAAMGFGNVKIRTGDGTAGWPESPVDGPAVFDRIIVTAGTPSVPQPLLDQLAPEGILVAPVGPADSQMLVRFNRVGEKMERCELFSCRFVPLVGAHGWPEAKGPA